jgi:hypothetical protein
MGIFHAITLTILIVSITGVLTPQSWAIKNQAAQNGNTSSTCSLTNLEQQTLDAGEVVTQQDAINFAVSSAQYQSTISGFTSEAFLGSNNGWSYNSDCAVSWNAVAVSFVATAPNGSKFTIVVSENPLASVIYNVQVLPTQPAAISPSGGPYWSGYAIAGNSHDTQQLYESEAYWTSPAVSQPPSGYGSTCTLPPGECDVASWVGLTNATSASSGGYIVQTGIQAYFHTTGTPTALYNGWTEVYPTQSGEVACPSTDVAKASDSMEGNVENQFAYLGTTGNNYYIFLDDYTQSWLCTPTTNPQSVSFTPVYSAFIAELTGGSNYELAKFASFNFTDCSTYIGTQVGVYSYYSSGYGYGAYMDNNGHQNTITYAMSHSAGSQYGNFEEAWNTSLGT